MQPTQVARAPAYGPQRLTMFRRLPFVPFPADVAFEKRGDFMSAVSRLEDMSSAARDRDTYRGLLEDLKAAFLASMYDTSEGKVRAPAARPNPAMVTTFSSHPFRRSPPGPKAEPELWWFPAMARGEKPRLPGQFRFSGDDGCAVTGFSSSRDLMDILPRQKKIFLIPSVIDRSQLLEVGADDLAVSWASRELGIVFLARLLASLGKIGTSSPHGGGRVALVAAGSMPVSLPKGRSAPLESDELERAQMPLHP